jgi:hypothetical protein
MTVRHMRLETWRTEHIDAAPYLADVVEATNDEPPVYLCNGSPDGFYAYTIYRIGAYGWIDDVYYEDDLQEAYAAFNELVNG